VSIRGFNDFQRAAMTPADASAFISTLLVVDVRNLAPRIRAPVLVVHRRGDLVVPYALGREIASLIPGAKLETMEGNNHAPSLEEGDQIDELQQTLSAFFAADLPSEPQ
jgi:pimeloyl-ACP methyl ester carboxylesterase